MRFWLESGKNMQEHVHFLYLFQIFCRCSLLLFFFSRVRSTAGGGRGREILAPISALYMAFGPQGWRALIDLVDMIRAKSLVSSAILMYFQVISDPRFSFFKQL